MPFQTLAVWILVILGVLFILAVTGVIHIAGIG